MAHTKESIKALLATNDEAVLRGVEAIYALQTADEQNSEATKHQNGVGFNGRHAEFGSSLAKQIAAWRNGESDFRRPLSPKQLVAARKLILHYAGQLARLANEKESALQAT